ncbi:CaiB/BaiF CoA transferase family protein [Rhabdothermincola salaria]|uniref:CaiB/BaiF CoA transferase family protein n=1 Tax=Rhabdothermincola salaria TaxID=2903142 RepID=UPI001E47EBA9|nr:CaiB/BaiF CoA-transferase family protein [Rhabdothermincola salaria]MCD9622274.1 CoA transferase [Rhabdothermincola salaria]
MQLGDTGNPDALPFGRPLEGVRVLALEQMQALPYATQLLTRLGAEVVKIESVKGGDLGRGSQPSVTDPEGRTVGATFLRNNLNKRSICVDLKSDAGRQLVLDLIPRFDIVAENFKGGALARMGLGYDDVAAVHPEVVYVSVSGFGNTTPTPYDGWPAYAAIAEAMSGIYDYKRPPGQPPMASPVGALGDIGTALFATIGLLAALRHRDVTGQGQYVDVAMFDSMVAMTDIVVNFWSMGAWPKPGQGLPMILDGFEASNGWFIVQVGREHEFARLAELVGQPEWTTDERLATRQGWRDHMDDIIRPGLAAWAADKTNVEACFALAEAGVAAGPCLTPPQVIDDPHLAARNMVVEIPRPEGGDPVLTPGNPIKMSKMPDGPETRMPWLGEHTDEVLASELGLDADAIARLRDEGVIA